MASGNGVPQQVGMAGQQRMQPGPISPSQVNYGPSVTEPPGQRPVPQDENVMNVGGPVRPPSDLIVKRTPTPQSGPKLAPPVMPQVLDSAGRPGGGGKAGGRVQQQQQQAPQAPNINQSAAQGIQGAMAGAAREMNYQPMNVRSPGYRATQTGAQGYGAAQAGARGFQGADVGATGYGAAQAGATGFGAADVGSQGFQAAGLGAQGYGAERAGATGFQAAGLGAQGYDAARTGATGFGAERLGGAPTVTSRDVTAGQLAGTDLSQYYNPYESQVVQSTLSDLDRARQISMGQAGAQASAAGAFGGSRQALMEA